MKDFPCHIKPFVVGFDILDLIDILKKYDVSQKVSIAIIKFYCGEKL